MVFHTSNAGGRACDNRPVHRCVSWIIHLVPGDPVRDMLVGRSNPVIVAQVRHQIGLDQPLWHQYLRFITGAVHGNFGYSFTLNQPISTVLRERAVATFWLVTYAVFVSVVLGMPLACAVGSEAGPVGGPGRPILQHSCFCHARFWLGLVLALLFGLKLGWLPVTGYTRSPSPRRSVSRPFRRSRLDCRWWQSSSGSCARA